MHRPEPFSFTSYSKFMEYWLLIVVGLVLCALNRLMPATVTDRTVGIIFLMTLIFTSMAIAIDFDVTSSWILFLLTSLLALGLLLIAKELDIALFQTVLRWIGLIDFRMNRDTVMTITLVFGFIWIMTYAYCKFWHRWVVSVGKMERRVFGRRVQEEPISSLRFVVYEIPDIMDFLLTSGGGNLVVKDQNGKTLLVIENVWNVMKIDRRIDQGFEVLPTDEASETEHPPSLH